ncbi:MAG TPA: hypothetical protein V6C65_13390 [Allocoleopsis sp.]
MTKYHRVEVPQPEDDEKLAELMKERDLQAIATYLSQWDCGEYHAEARELPSDPYADRHQISVENSGDYVLTINWGMGWVGLYVSVESIERLAEEE